VCNDNNSILVSVFSSWDFSSRSGGGGGGGGHGVGSGGRSSSSSSSGVVVGGSSSIVVVGFSFSASFIGSTMNFMSNIKP
jgi:hypothetical protein